MVYPTSSASIINQSVSICHGTTFNLPWGGSAATSGIYSHSYPVPNGRDSIVNITLYIYPQNNINQTASICQGSTYSLPWGGSAGSVGTYSHTYASVSGCDSLVNIALSINPIFTRNQTASICQGSTYSLPWGGSAGSAGTYSHTYALVSGCDSVVNITLSINPIFTNNQTATTCQGVAFNLPWGGTANTAGTYSHTYSTSSGCDSLVNITLSISSIFTNNQTATTCQGVAFNLPWGGTASTAGTYSHTYASASGCDSLVNITLSINPIFTNNQTATTCQGVAFNLPWGGIALAGANSHVYSSINGCDSLVTINLTIKPVYNLSINAVACANQPYYLPWGGIGVEGSNWHLYSTINGCDSLVTINLTLNPVQQTNLSISICNGGSFPLPWGGSATIAGNYSHLYTSGSGCDSIVSIQLFVSVIDVSVLATPTICIGQSAILAVSASGGSPPFSYLWNNGVTNSNQVVTPVATTAYYVIVRDNDGCSSVPQSMTVHVNPPLSVDALGIQPICSGENATISAIATGGNGGPYAFTWNQTFTSGTAVVSPTFDSTFVVVVTDGCGTPAAMDSIRLVVHPSPDVSFLPSLIYGCSPVMATFQNYSLAPAGSTYTWDLGDHTSSYDQNPSHLYEVPGTYNVSLTVQSPHGCYGHDFVQNAVIVFGLPEAGFSQSTDIVSLEFPEVVFQDNSLDAVKWEWDFGDSTAISNERNPIHRYDKIGEYKVRLSVESDGGCVDSAYHALRVQDGFSIFIPNSFTPNYDMINDVFICKGIGFKDFNMWIIDRWGKEIFHSTSIDEPWDGTFNKNGNPCQNDVYEYIISVKDYSNTEHKYIGHVTLVR